MSTEKLSAVLTVDIEKDQAEKELERLRSPKTMKMLLDVWALKQQLQAVQSEIKKLWDAAPIQLRADAEQLRRQITIANREITNFVRTGDKDVSMLWKMFQRLWLDINSWFWKSISQATWWLAQFASKWMLLLWWAAIWAWLFQLWKNALMMGDKFEQASLSFWVMLGSADKAKEMLLDLNAFAAKTPFEVQWIRDSAKQLMAFWISSENIIPTLKILGDTAAATGTPLEQIAYAYGQVRTAWQLYGSELRQFTQAGVPLLAELAKMYWTTEASAKKMVEDWKVWFNDVQEAFRRMTAEWWKFNNMMEVQSQTFSWKVSNMKDTFNQLLESWGTNMTWTWKWIVDWITEILKWVSNVPLYMQIAAAFFADRWLSMQLNVQIFVLNAKILFEKFVSLMSMIWDNVWILWYNIWQWFKAVPSIIWNILNAAIWKIEDFINFAWRWISELASKVWMSIDIPEFKLPKLDITENVAAFKSFKSMNMDVVAWLQAQKESAISNTQIMKDSIMWETVTLLQQLDKQNEWRKINTQLTKENVNKAADEEWKAAKKWKDAIKAAEKEKERIMKENVERQKKIFQDLKNKRKEELDNINNYIKKLKDALKEITDIEKEMSDVSTDAQKSTLDEAASRYRDLLEKQKDLQKEIKDEEARLYNEWVQGWYGGAIYTVDPAKLKELEDVKKYIEEIRTSGLMDQNAIAKEDQRASLDTQWQSRFDFQDKVWWIAIDKANKLAELQKKKMEVEENLWMKKEQAEKELIIQEQRKEKNERALKKYEEIISLIERGITENTQKEIDKRMALYAQEEQRLLRLIQLRMAAGYAVWAIDPAPVTNTVNNNPQVTVNANVANSVDVNNLANTLARKISLSSKWIS